MRARLASLAACLVAFAATAAPARAEVLTPSGNWTTRAEEERCRANLTFGEGEARHILQVASYGPGSAWEIIVAGSLLPGLESRGQPTELRFDTDRPPQRIFGIYGSSGGMKLVRL